MPDAAALDLTNGMTLEAWVRPTSLGSAWRTVVFKEQSGYYTYALYANTDTVRPSANGMIAGVDRDLRGTSALPLNAWTHLAATFDGTTLRLYVDGNLVGSQAAAGLARDVDRRASLRRQRGLGRVLPGPDRRGPHLQPSAVADRDPDRHDAERQHARHDAAVARRAR